MTQGQESFKWRKEGTMDAKNPIIKAIQFQNALYLLDIMGNVSKYIGATGLN